MNIYKETFVLKSEDLKNKPSFKKVETERLKS